MSKPRLSIVVPYHNEGLEFISTTIRSIQDTIDVHPYEIIIVDDHSNTPLSPIEGVTILRHDKPKGVGQAFDTGVREAKSDNLFLMGSDIRFIPNQWASNMIGEINKHPKAFTCTTCIGLNAESEEGMDINKRRNRSRRNGANILVFHDKKSHSKKPENFRNILECQWLPLYRGVSKESFEIPSILGAAYGVKKEWYDYIDGWWGHRSWGTLEPYISLKSWFMGGSCRTAPDIETGHIFKRHGTHGTPHSHLIYNKLLTATLLFDDFHSQRLINFLGRNPQVDGGKKMFTKEDKAIRAKRKEYEKKIVVDSVEWCERWNIDFRLD
jgi:glycosyltransferase involved in cell wall biosynthesis